MQMVPARPVLRPLRPSARRPGPLPRGPPSVAALPASGAPIPLRRPLMRRLLPLVLLSIVLIPVGAARAGAHAPASIHRVTVPDEDRFAPFAITIHVGEAVKRVNHDTDDHTVVSDDYFDTAGHKGTDHLLPSGGVFVLSFSHPGTFVYYCRFHAHLD